MPNKIVIKGARVNNLKNVNLEIPKNKLVVITGLSGSGKSSLAFDTIYAEGQRRYAESLSSYARQFMEVGDKPDVDSIEGLSPTIAVDQKVHTQNPRSTVGTLTEIYDYLRLLFTRAGKQHCPDCQVAVEANSAGVIVEKIKRLFRRDQKKLTILSPLVRKATVETKGLLSHIEKAGYEKIRINGEVIKIHDFRDYRFNGGTEYDVDLVIGEITDIKKQDISKLVEVALELSNGLVKILHNGKGETIYSTVGLCPQCGLIIPSLDMRSFSFNSPHGACQRCTGLGVTMEVNPELVIPNNRLTLAEGAIQPWTRITSRQNQQQEVLKEVAARHNFSLDVPVKDLPSKVLDIVMYGTGKETYNLNGKKLNFFGVVPNLVQKHLETDSDYVRKEIEQYMEEATCSVCNGKRLQASSLAVKIGDNNIADVANLSLEDTIEFLKTLPKEFTGDKQALAIAKPIIKEMSKRVANLVKVGLGYLNLDRSMNTLSGGEVTRVRLATQLSAGLIDVIYVLDEPSIGLHPKDNSQLISSIKALRDLGNTVVVVEHDQAMMEAADYIIDVGPGAGANGGKIVAQGKLADVKKNKNSLTADYLTGRAKVECAPQKADKKAKDKFITVVGAKAFNLKNINVDIPLGKLVCVSGVSGSGKSSLIIDILSKALTKHFYRAKNTPGPHKEIKGVDNIDKIIAINQAPIGRTPRSNPATYTNIFTLIRDLFANLPESKMHNYSAGKFSFNVKGGGRCEGCSGEGYVCIPMQFLSDVYVECVDCSGTRYSKEVLEVHYKGKNIADILDMTVDEAYNFFNTEKAIADKLNVLLEVGLGYLRLGQPATTLSGGEAQRIKLATELSRSSTGKTLYVLDEPTTGLHLDDVKRLLQIMNKLVSKGNTVVVIEHNLELMSCADWVIDLGPGGGRHGGEVIAAGSPQQVAKIKKSWTGKYLAPLLKQKK